MGRGSRRPGAAGGRGLVFFYLQVFAFFFSPEVNGAADQEWGGGNSAKIDAKKFDIGAGGSSVNAGPPPKKFSHHTVTLMSPPSRNFDANNKEFFRRGDRRGGYSPYCVVINILNREREE